MRRKILLYIFLLLFTSYSQVFYKALFLSIYEYQIYNYLSLQVIKMFHVKHF